MKVCMRSHSHDPELRLPTIFETLLILTQSSNLTIFKPAMKEQTQQEPIKNHKGKLKKKSKRTIEKTCSQSSVISGDHSLQGNPEKAVKRELLFGQLKCGEQNAKEVRRMLFSNQDKPGSVFPVLLRLYKQCPDIYHQRTMDKTCSEEQDIPMLFPLVRFIIENYQEVPFFEREFVVIILEDLSRQVCRKNTPLSRGQLETLQEINNSIWRNNVKNDLDSILQNAVKYLSRIAVMLSHGERTRPELQKSKSIVQMNLRQLISALENVKDEHTVFKTLLFNSYKQVIQALADASSSLNCALPLFDIAALSFISLHHDFYGKLIVLMFQSLKLSLEQKREEQCDRESESFKESEQAIKMVFAACQLFNFESIFAEDGTAHYSREVIFLVLHVYKKIFMRLLDELEKIRRTIVQEDIIRNMFCMSIIGSNINREKALQQILSKVMTAPQWRKELKLGQSVAASTQEESKLQVINLIATHQKSLFQLLYRIQKLLTHFDLDIYMGLYIEHPLTFVSLYFMEHMFKNQQIDTILSFMTQFTKRWILDEKATFDFNFYLMLFLKKCVRRDTIQVIGTYVKSLEVPELLKINEVIFKLSFEEDKKKYGIPESIDWDIQLAHLTSAGFADKFLLVNKIFPCFSQQLVWKEVIHSLNPSQNYIYVKAFYNVINYEFNFKEDNIEKLVKIIQSFENALNKENIEYIYSIFHLICCICLRKDPLSKFQEQGKARIEQQVFEWLMTKASELITLCDEVCERRRRAMNHVVLSTQLMNVNLRYFEKMKKMHVFFLKSVVRWIERLQNVDKIINHSRTYEEVIEICLKLGSNIEFGEFHLIRTLSHYCSQNYFGNTLEKKIKPKVISLEMVSTSHLLYLREIMHNYVNKYESQSLLDEYCLNESQILGYYEMILSAKLQIACERQLLKHKLIVLDNVLELLIFFSINPDSQLATEFNAVFHSSFKYSIIEIAVQNPEFVSKYERELIMHLRTTAIKQIILLYGSPYEIMPIHDLFSFVLELCFDKMVEIRVLILNLMVSRFKSDEFQHFVAQKYRIASFLTIFSIFEPIPILNITARKIVETIKKSGEESTCLGLLVLIVSLKYILNDILNGILREEYYIYLDTFLKLFDEIWMMKREWEYATYSFINQYLEENRVTFRTNELRYRSFIQRYIIPREKTDFILESEIKEYMRSQLSFEMPPDDEPISEGRQQFVKQLMETLPYRIFQRLKQIITDKGRPTRRLKERKDIQIHWRELEEKDLVVYHGIPVQIEKVNLTLP